MRLAAAAAALLACSCQRYADFTLPVQTGSAARVEVEWKAASAPVIARGAAAPWDTADALNPSVIRDARGYLNLYSGYDGRTWYTLSARSSDGLLWSGARKVLSPDPATWEGDYIAANGTLLHHRGEYLYWYQGARLPRIGLAASNDGESWTKLREPVLRPGPRGSWDERGVADPYVVAFDGWLYMYYLGQDRARRQRLGVARSADGRVWQKLRGNPILETGEPGAFDETGLGEPAVWSARGSYWMLYTARDRREERRMGLARSTDGVQWTRVPGVVIAGDQPWNAHVVCDPTVDATTDPLRVWFGGGDRPRPDENLNGQIGFATLKLR